MTIQEFIAQENLQIQCVKLLGRPEHCDPKWQANHYQVRIYSNLHGPKELITTYSMGLAHKKAPQLPGVLDSLASDASSAEQSFDSWASDYGYDTDSRKAVAIYDACQANRKKMIDLLGQAAFNTLVNDVERL